LSRLPRKRQVHRLTDAKSIERFLKDVITQKGLSYGDTLPVFNGAGVSFNIISPSSIARSKPNTANGITKKNNAFLFFV